MKAIRSILAILLISTLLLVSCDLLSPPDNSDDPVSEVDAEATIAAIVSGTQTAQADDSGGLPDPTAGATEGSTTAPSPTDPPTPEPPLPQALVFLTREAGWTHKIAKLEQDGATLTYLTTTPEEIRSIAINPVDGSIAYVANNNIYHMNGDGTGKYILIAGVPPASLSTYDYMESLQGLAWSNDGQTLAFGRGGLNLYHMGTGLIDNLLVNILNSYGDPAELYFPSQYSPSGSKLLVRVAWMEGGTMGVYDFSDSSFTYLGPGTGAIVGDFAWSLNSNKVYFASPYLGMFDSGFWEYNATSGVKTTLITNGPGIFYSPGWPIKLGNGEMNFFMATSSTIPEGFFDLYMVQSVGGDVTNTVILNPTGYRVREAEWTSDGAFAAIIIPRYSGGADPTPIKIISTDGTPEINVHPNGTMLRWVP
jgi:hypothetical protein